MRRLLLALPALLLLRADMYPDASNAKNPQALNNLTQGAGTYHAPAYGGTWDATHDVGPSINAAVAAAAVGGGGLVQLPPGAYVYGTTLVMASGVALRAPRSSAGAGGTGCVTTLTWNGAAGGDLIQVGSDTAQVFGAGVSGICFKGADLAGRGFVLRGSVAAEISDNYLDGVTVTAWDIDIARTADLPTADNRFIANKTNLVSTGSVNANAWVIGPGSAANDSFRNFWQHDRTTYQNGVGFTCGNADANHYENGQIVPTLIAPNVGPLGPALVLNGSNTVGLFSCRENFFDGLFGRSTAGTGPIAHGGTQMPSRYNYINQNQENGAPTPILDMPAGGTQGAILEYDTTRGLRRRADFSLNNEGVTGTIQYGVVRLSGGGTAISAPAGVTDGGIGVAIATGGTLGAAMIVNGGRVPCLYDGPVTVGRWVGYSPTQAGNCHDTGVSSLTGQRPSGTIGIAQQTGGSAGYYDTVLNFARSLTNYSAVEFGVPSLVAATTAYYAGGITTTGGTINDNAQVAPTAETFDFLRVSIPTAPGVGKNITYTFNTGARGAIAPTTLTCTISGAALSCADNTHSAAVVGGQLWNLQATSDAGAAATGTGSISLRRTM